MIHKKQPKNVEYFTYLGNIIAYNARCIHENKSRIDTTEAAFNWKNFHQQTGFNFKEENSKVLNLERSVVWC